MNIMKTTHIQLLIISALAIIILAMPSISKANHFGHNKHNDQRSQNTYQPKHINKPIKRHAIYVPNASHSYQPRHSSSRSYDRGYSVYTPPHRVDLHNLNVVFGLQIPSIGVIVRH